MLFPMRRLTMTTLLTQMTPQRLIRMLNRTTLRLTTVPTILKPFKEAWNCEKTKDPNA